MSPSVAKRRRRRLRRTVTATSTDVKWSWHVVAFNERHKVTTLETLGRNLYFFYINYITIFLYVLFFLQEMIEAVSGCVDQMKAQQRMGHQVKAITGEPAQSEAELVQKLQPQKGMEITWPFVAACSCL